MTTETKRISIPTNAARAAISLLFCKKMEELLTCSKKNAIVIDPGQHIYDYIQKHVKTREDYVLVSNTLTSGPNLDTFMSLKLDKNNPHIDKRVINFTLLMQKELDAYAQAAGFTKVDPPDARQVRQLLTLLTSKYSDTHTQRLMDLSGIGWTGAVSSDLSTVAHHNGYTLREFLGTRVKLETNPLVEYFNTVLNEFAANGQYLLSTTIEETDSLRSVCVFTHSAFLIDLYRNSLLLPSAQQHIRVALQGLFAERPNAVRSAFTKAGGHDDLCDSDMFELMQ